MFEQGDSFALQDSDGQALQLQTGRLEMQARNNIRKLRLQARAQARIDSASFENLTGIMLPGDPRGPANLESPVYWLAPNDWLLVNPVADSKAIDGALREASNGATCAVTDLSAAYSIIDLSGSGAQAGLAAGCSVDLDTDAFPAGCYVLTRLQHLPVIIHRLAEAMRYRIVVERGSARYLWDWLEQCEV